MFEPVLNLEYDIKKGTGLINIEPPKKYADQVVSFDFDISYDHLEDLENDSNKYDVMNFITKHDQSIKDGLSKFEFDDGKTYKVQRELIIKDPERLNAQISYFKGEKKITSTWQGQSSTWNLCDVVYCDEIEFLNDENGYLSKFPKDSNYVINTPGSTAFSLFDLIWSNGITATYDKRTGIVKKKDHIFDGEIIRLNDQEPFDFRIELRDENIHHRKIEKFRDFIGNEIHLTVNERELPYKTIYPSLYSNTKRKWIITYYDLNRSQSIPTLNNPVYGGNFTIEVFEIKERVYTNIDPVWTIGGHYFFYKQ